MLLSQIREGAKYINDKLKDKLYFHPEDTVQKLLFNSLDLDQLTETGDSEEGTSIVLENDKHIINVIYELLEKVERSKTQQEQQLAQFHKQQNEIAQLQRQTEALNVKLQRQEDQLYAKDLEILRLNRSLKETIHDKIHIKKERNQLKLLNENLKEKQKIETKKKNLEIDELRGKLIVKLSSINVNSKPLAMVLQFPQTSDQLGPPTRPLINEIINKQTQTLLENSSNLIYDLVSSNELNCQFLSTVNQYFEALGNKIDYNNDQFLKTLLPNFKQFESQLNEKRDINDDLNTAINEMSNFEDLKAGFMKNLSKFDKLIEVKINETPSVSNDELNNLRTEIETLKHNWEKLNENAENWKKLYKDSVKS